MVIFGEGTPVREVITCVFGGLIEQGAVTVTVCVCVTVTGSASVQTIVAAEVCRPAEAKATSEARVEMLESFMVKEIDLIREKMSNKEMKMLGKINEEKTQRPCQGKDKIRKKK